jgi:hypothetical protein
MFGLGKTDSQMNCLYCDRPLALLKRLTGDGEFCSKEHRKLYQQEHNQLAVARLLEAQRVVKVPAPVKAKEPDPSPASAPKSVRARQPQTANFVAEYSREAKADSGLARFTGDPRFGEFTTVLGGAPAHSTQPITAVFQFETLEPRSFPGAIRFPSRSALRVSEQLAETLSSYSAGVAVRALPRGAGFVSERPPSPVAAGTREASGQISNQPEDAAQPRFKIAPRAIDIGTGPSAAGGDSKLRPAQFLSGAGAPRPASDRVRLLPLDTRWNAFQTALPERVPAGIAPVLGSLLRRPVRAAGLGDVPAVFEIPLRPLSFPPVALVMASLSERPHQTDRLGFTPP